LALHPQGALGDVVAEERASVMRVIASAEARPVPPDHEQTRAVRSAFVPVMSP
jgi:hypothetical protein